MNQITKGALLLILLSFICTNCKDVKSVDSISLPYFKTADFTPEWIDNPDNSIHTIGSFSFINQNGLTITNVTVENKIYIANFFFTICPGICPIMTENMYKIQEAFKKENDVLLLSHTVTPWIDTPERLNSYAKEKMVDSDKWHLLTGREEEIYQLARRSYFADKEIGHKTEDDDFLHTENFILIDKKQRIRGIYNGTKSSDIDRLSIDIKILLNELN